MSNYKGLDEENHRVIKGARNSFTSIFDSNCKHCQQTYLKDFF